MEWIRGQDQQNELVQPGLGKLDREVDHAEELLDVGLSSGAADPALLALPLCQEVFPEISDDPDCSPPGVLTPELGLVCG